ncbi:eCIS core domain-containing protein [Algicella marina]|uniref:DUF4157 domain-containing protein n=1 Tax=Algicella marina TaxID=2683284 RepID=A0A6P1T4K3_9RHOB|nr:DUF4157 domain-containing protein [Algicella marina]QHQ36675.1 DUF4157 domain-containing protein [Algicella marina]
MRVQAKRHATPPPVRLGQLGDVQEREADQTAARIMRGGLAAPILAATSPTVSPSAVGPGPAAAAPVARAARAIRTGGQPLTAPDRAFLEPAFGRNLSAVRIHTGATAAGAAQAIGATAYAHRNHIAFAPGQYRPGTPAGRHLLAHEITHTLQQGSAGTIRRTCPSDANRIPEGDMDDFETMVDEIHAHGNYSKRLAEVAKKFPKDPIAQEGKEAADQIIDGARASACPMYYITELKALFDTVPANRKQTAKNERAAMTQRAGNETLRIFTAWDPIAFGLSQMEEAVAHPTEHKGWRKATGNQGKTFLIDDSDPTNILVYMKVRVTVGANGQPLDVENVKALEDAIEKESAQPGYMVNIEFVDTPGDDVFEVQTDPEDWPHSTNWVKGAGTLSHEAHHLLGLEDRYDYIESHATNENMRIDRRLHVFRRQMVRAPDALKQHSKMERSRSDRRFNEQDLCALGGTSADYRGCLVARFGMRPAMEIRGIGRSLMHPYDPRNAALLEVLREAWDSRPAKEREAGCQTGDPLCGIAPESAFGDPNIIGNHADDHGLPEPHDPPSPDQMKRKARKSP